MTTNLPTRLNQLGDVLETAAAADLGRRGALATAEPTEARRRRGVRLPRRIAIGVVALAVVLPGAALAANYPRSAPTTSPAASPPGRWPWPAPNRPAPK